MRRREFIKYGTAGMVTMAVGANLVRPRKAHAQVVDVDLTIVGADFEMVDGTPVYFWAYVAANDGGPRTPGPVIEAWEGDIIRCRITNSSSEEHGFAVHGTPPPVVDAGIIDPGQSKTIEFEAPRAGTYLYCDPLNAPVNRCLGLHGVLVVLPADPNEKTPYSNPTPAVRKLFNDLGDASKGFPGKGWDQKRVYPNGRCWVWVFNEIDPKWNHLADLHKHIDPKDFVAGFLPRYFTLNGDSGWFIAHNLNTSPRAKEGEPALLRTLMAGLGTRPPHIHGNHVYLISKVNSRGEPEPQSNVIELDTWTVKPGECIDVLLPFRRPPDVPMGKWPPKEEGFPITYPIHPHDEVSVTAAGGMYPQGIMNDWHMTEPTTADPGNSLDFKTEPHNISFQTFGCDPPRRSPSTPDKLNKVDVVLHREFYSGGEVVMPDGRRVEVWGFEDPNDPSTRRQFPSPLIRLRQGQTVHCNLKVSKHAHTIHWHGIEPTCHNDGVPHNSFGVKTRYTYQFQANQAGTYFYHCHWNTVLHFQMGMYGLLIVDPPDGPGRLCVGGPTYDTEMLLTLSDIDPSWRELPGGHNAGMCGEDVGLNNFRPKYFLINGVPHPNSLTDTRAVTHAKTGDDVLVRLLGASYCILMITFPFDVEVVEVDGRPLFASASNHGYSHPFTVRAGRAIEMETAQRKAVLARNLPAGEYKVRVEFRDVIRPNHLFGVAETLLIVSDQGQPDEPNQPDQPDQPQPEPGQDTITVTRARFDHSTNKWTVKGTTSVKGPGNEVTIYLGATLGGTVVGSDEVNKRGKWSFSKKNVGVLPDASGLVSLKSSAGGELLGVEVDIVGQPQDNGNTGGGGADEMKVTRSVFRTKTSEWRIEGTSTVKENNTVTIFLGSTLGGTILGTADVNSKGKWKFNLKNAADVPQDGDTISVASSQGGQVLAVPVKIK